MGDALPRRRFGIIRTMQRALKFWLFIFAAALTGRAETNVLSDVLAIRHACWHSFRTNAAFAVEGRLRAYHYRPSDHSWNLTLDCRGKTFESSSIGAETYRPGCFVLNDRLRLRGRLRPRRNSLLPCFGQDTLVRWQNPILQQPRRKCDLARKS